MIFTKKRVKRYLIYIGCAFTFSVCSKKLKPVEEGLEEFENTLILISIDGFRWDYLSFANTPNLDEFVTLYGENPAVELSKGVLLKIFGMQDEYLKWKNMEDGPEKDALKEEILQKMADKLIIDMEENSVLLIDELVDQDIG